MKLSSTFAVRSPTPTEPDTEGIQICGRKSSENPCGSMSGNSGGVESVIWALAAAGEVVSAPSVDGAAPCGSTTCEAVNVGAGICVSANKSLPRAVQQMRNTRVPVWSSFMAIWDGED